MRVRYRIMHSAASVFKQWERNVLGTSKVLLEPVADGNDKTERFKIVTKDDDPPADREGQDWAVGPHSKAGWAARRARRAAYESTDPSASDVITQVKDQLMQSISGNARGTLGACLLESTVATLL